MSSSSYRAEDQVDCLGESIQLMLFVVLDGQWAINIRSGSVYLLIPSFFSFFFLLTHGVILTASPGTKAVRGSEGAAEGAVR